MAKFVLVFTAALLLLTTNRSHANGLLCQDHFAPNRSELSLQDTSGSPLTTQQRQSDAAKAWSRIQPQNGADQSHEATINVVVKDNAELAKLQKDIDRTKTFINWYLYLTRSRELTKLAKSRLNLIELRTLIRQGEVRQAVQIFRPQFERFNLAYSRIFAVDRAIARARGEIGGGEVLEGTMLHDFIRTQMKTIETDLVTFGRYAEEVSTVIQYLAEIRFKGSVENAEDAASASTRTDSAPIVRTETVDRISATANQVLSQLMDPTLIRALNPELEMPSFSIELAGTTKTTGTELATKREVEARLVLEHAHKITRFLFRYPASYLEHLKSIRRTEGWNLALGATFSNLWFDVINEVISKLDRVPRLQTALRLLTGAASDAVLQNLYLREVEHVIRMQERGAPCLDQVLEYNSRSTTKNEFVNYLVRIIGTSDVIESLVTEAKTRQAAGDPRMGQAVEMLDQAIVNFKEKGFVSLVYTRGAAKTTSLVLFSGALTYWFYGPEIAESMQSLFTVLKDYPMATAAGAGAGASSALFNQWRTRVHSNPSLQGGAPLSQSSP